MVIREITIQLWRGLDWVFKALDLGLVELGLFIVAELGGESFTPQN